MPHAPGPDSNSTDQTSSGFTPCGHDIDTVCLRIEEPIAPAALRALDGYEERYGDEGWLSSTAKHGNLYIKATETLVRVRGSLAVFIGGTNAAPFNHGAVRPALSEIAEVLGLPDDSVLGAAVTRLDVGVNVPLPMPVAEVTGNVLAPSRRRLLHYGPASIGVETTTSGLFVYDKRLERGQRDVDPCYGDGPLARVELRYKRQVERQLGRPVTAALLADPAFFEDLGHRLLGAAEAVPFRRATRITEAAKVPELRDSYALRGIEASGGFEAAHSAVTVASQSGYLGPPQTYALRRWLRRLRANPSLTEPLDVEAEFRRAVRDAVGTRTSNQ